MPGRKSRLIGCLLGGAIGDAMGYPVEFMRYADIARYFGGAGVRDLSASTLVSDDTQMTLFAAEAIIKWLSAQANGGADDSLRSIPSAANVPYTLRTLESI